jgi:hypothetical protein
MNKMIMNILKVMNQKIMIMKKMKIIIGKKIILAKKIKIMMGKKMKK